MAALADEDVAWVRAPALDKRFAHGDDFAGDAWRNELTGAVRYTVVGQVFRE
jgi:hypothetical protein